MAAVETFETGLAGVMEMGMDAGAWSEEVETENATPAAEGGLIMPVIITCTWSPGRMVKGTVMTAPAPSPDWGLAGLPVPDAVW